MFANFVDPSAADYVVLRPVESALKACPSLPQLPARDKANKRKRAASFAGTVFRLALRGAGTARGSKINNKVISPAEATELLHAFAAEAPNLLLFTQHVQRITVHVIAPDAPDSSVQLLRAAVTAKLVPAPGRAGISLTELTVTTHRHSQGSGSRASSRGGGHHQDEVWLRGVDSAAGVALLCRRQAAGGPARVAPQLCGRIHCCMPLAYDRTGLPVHINSLRLELQSDRRNLWAGLDDRGKGARNMAVLQDHVAAVWVRVLEAAKAYGLTGADVMRLLLLLAGRRLDPEPLRALVPALMRHLLRSDAPLLWCADSADDAAGRWVRCRQLVLLPPGDAAAAAAGASGSGNLDDVALAARTLGLAVVQLPEADHKVLTEEATRMSQPLQVLGPAVLADALRKAGSSNPLPRALAKSVLSYLWHKEHCLDGLPLLPLANGSMGTFRFGPGTGEGQQAYLLLTGQTDAWVEEQLRAHCPERLIDSQKAPVWRQIAQSEAFKAGTMGMRLPGWADAAQYLPAAWKGHICARAEVQDAPPADWVDRFWSQVQKWGEVPKGLWQLMLVPVSGGKLASVVHCRAAGMLTTAQLDAICQTPQRRKGVNQAPVKELLGKLGCVYSEAAAADCVMDDRPPGSMPLIEAITAAASLGGFPLRSVINRLDDDERGLLRQLVAREATGRQAPAVGGMPLFQTVQGSWRCITSGPGQAEAVLAPDDTVEQLLAKAPAGVVGFEVLQYHTAEQTQQSLLRAAGLAPPPLFDFCTNRVFNNSRLQRKQGCMQPILLHLLAALSGHLLDSQQEQVLQSTPLVYSSDGTLRTASHFIGPSAPAFLRKLFNGCTAEFELLPDAYRKQEIITTLERAGLRLRLAVDMLEAAAESAQAQLALSGPDAVVLPIALPLAQRISTKYAAWQHQPWPRNPHRWSSLKDFVCKARIFPTEELCEPYRGLAAAASVRRNELMTLQEVCDHRDYWLVCSATAVAHKALDLHVLQSAMGERAGPRVEDVVTHLINLTAPRVLGGEPLAQWLDANKAVRARLLEDNLEAMYDCILRAPDAAGEVERLKDVPWVWLDSGQLVCADSLRFNLVTAAEDAGGIHALPAVLQKVLQKHGQQAKQLLQRLGAEDTEEGAPPMPTLAANPMPGAMLPDIAQHFDNPDAWPDTKVDVCGGTILVHEHILARCPTLAAMWRRDCWRESAPGRSTRLEGTLCKQCGVEYRYEAARAFFQYFYTGKIELPGGAAVRPGQPGALQLATDLLVWGAYFQEAYIQSWAECFLRNSMVDTTSCAAIFAVAHHHAADGGLDKYCRHYAAKMRGAVHASRAYQQLPQALRAALDKPWQ